MVNYFADIVCACPLYKLRRKDIQQNSAHRSAVVSGTPLPNILVAHLLVSCLGVIVGTLMVIVCLSLMREAGRFKTFDLPISGPSSRVEGTGLSAMEEDD